jgi:hypothetical protein
MKFFLNGLGPVLFTIHMDAYFTFPTPRIFKKGASQLRAAGEHQHSQDFHTATAYYPPTASER